MKSISIVTLLLAATAAVSLRAQQPESRPASPDGTASVQVLGTWTKPPSTTTFSVDGYQGGKWIDILYGRPLLRGRTPFSGRGASYGKSIYGDGAPVWRAGANLTTRLRTEAALVIGGTTVPAGEYTVFVDLKQPTEWTFIVSRWTAQTSYDANNKTALYGAFGYTADKDVARAPMKVDTLPYSAEQVTWQFIDMTSTSGRMAISWDKTMASVPFTAKP